MTTPESKASIGLFSTPVHTPASHVIDVDAEVVDGVRSGPAALTSVHHHQEAPTGIVGEMLAYSKIAEGRDMDKILREARRVGERLADAAYYRWRQQGETIEGPSVKLMEALQGVWRDIAVEATIVEIVDTEHGERMTVRVQVVDLIARVVRRNDQSFTLAPPSGKFAEKVEQRERWRAMMQNKAISKAVRGCLEDVIPHFVVRAAMEAAFKAETTMALASKEGRVTREQAIEGAIEWAKSIGVSQAELEWKVGCEAAMWTASDILVLRRIAERINSGETSAGAEWAEYRNQAEAKPAASTASKGGLGDAKKARKAGDDE